jgi:3-isopropylmalate dehydratase small subunit
MEKFTRLTAPTACLPDANIDTDIIFPARFLLITEKIGLGRYAFHDKRRLAPPAGTSILIAGDNFGCGSSREQAVWALADLGIRCVISTGFGEIFRSNCFRNGILPIILSDELVARLGTAATLTVDLERRELTDPEGRTEAFDVEPWQREALLNGWDEVLTILYREADAIARFEARRRSDAPWLFEPI